VLFGFLFWRSEVRRSDRRAKVIAERGGSVRKLQRKSGFYDSAGSAIIRQPLQSDTTRKLCDRIKQSEEINNVSRLPGGQDCCSFNSAPRQFVDTSPAILLTSDSIPLLDDESGAWKRLTIRCTTTASD